jgi:hypothetical protein
MASTITDELRFVLQNLRLRPSDSTQANIVQRAIDEIASLERRIAELKEELIDAEYSTPRQMGWVGQDGRP